MGKPLKECSFRGGGITRKEGGGASQRTGIEDWWARTAGWGSTGGRGKGERRRKGSDNRKGTIKKELSLSYSCGSLSGKCHRKLKLL